MKPISDNNNSDIYFMCNKVETLVIKLEEQHWSHKLDSESVIYTLLKKKLTIKALQEYKEYIQRNKKEENVHTLLDWLKEKVKIQTELQEDLFGFESTVLSLFAATTLIIAPPPFLYKHVPKS